MTRFRNISSYLASVALVATLAATTAAPRLAHAETLSGIDADTLTELSFEPVSIVIYKRKRALVMYNYGARKRQYPIVLGPNASGPKRYEGDLRTPEGLYRIDQLRVHNRWRYFLSINYPNARDEKAYRDNLAEGLIPLDRGAPARIGGALGIHGNDRPKKQGAAEDWTRGCVAMHNEDIDELYTNVKIGTPVLILEGSSPIADHLTAMIDSRSADGSTGSR